MQETLISVVMTSCVLVNARPLCKRLSIIKSLVVKDHGDEDGAFEGPSIDPLFMQIALCLNQQDVLPKGSDDYHVLVLSLFS